MDMSSDSAEKATFTYLMNGSVYGASGLTPEHAVEVIEKHLHIALPLLRRMTLSAIGKQVDSKVNAQLTGEFAKQWAFKVYTIGDEAWADADRAEYWFVDRNGYWYWVKHATASREVDFATVTVNHLLERFTGARDDGLVPLYVISSICGSFRHEFLLAADRARELQADLTKAANAMLLGSTETTRFVPPTST